MSDILKYKNYGKHYNNEKVIVSLTSHAERLFASAPISIFSILNGIEKSVHIVLTIFKDDIENIKDAIKQLIDNNIIEVIIAEKNLKPHLKYYYAMKKYKTIPIITIDDDCIYTPDFVKSLLDCYETHKNSVCARRVHAISPIKNTPYLAWKQYQISDNTIPSSRKFITGVGGVLYPPNILDIDKINLEEVNKCLNNDDIFLKVLENRKEIDIQIVPCLYKHPIQIKNNITLSTALSNKNVINHKNDYYLQLFANDIWMN